VIMPEQGTSDIVAVKPPRVADLSIGSIDLLGEPVERLFSRVDPLYAIYESRDRVLIQFADDPALATLQRARLTTLATMRARIDSLITRADRGGSKRGSGTYQARIAEALACALNDEIGPAIAILGAIEHDLSAEVARRAIVRQLLIGFGASATIAATCAAFLALDALLSGNRFLAAAIGGAIGAFASYSLRARDIVAAEDVGNPERSLSVILAIITGTLAAVVLQGLFSSGVIGVAVGGLVFGAGSPLVLALLASFVAGFSERLVPDLLVRAEVVGSTREVTPPPLLASPGLLQNLISDTVDASITKGLAGAPLTKYRGFVKATIEPATDKGEPTAARIALAFSRAESDGSVLLQIDDGIDALTADYLVECEPEGFTRNRTVKSIRVPTNTDIWDIAIPVQIPPTSDRIWVQLFQSNRRLLIFELEVPEQFRAWES